MIITYRKINTFITLKSQNDFHLFPPIFTVKTQKPKTHLKFLRGHFFTQVCLFHEVTQLNTNILIVLNANI